MRHTLYLRRRGNFWYWRRGLPPRGGRRRCLDLSLGTEDRSTARRLAAALGAVFEELLTLLDDDLPAGAAAAIMQAARDMVLRGLAAERAARGPDAPGVPRRPAPDPATPDGLLDEGTTAELAAFLARVGDARPDGTGAIAVVPPRLASALMRRLPQGGTRKAALPSATAAAKDRAFRSGGVARVLEGDLAANDLAAAEPLLGRVLARLGLSLGGTARHLAAEAVMAGMVEAYRLDVDRNLGQVRPLANPAPQPQPAFVPPVAAPSESSAPAAAAVAAPSGAGLARPRSALSPDMLLSDAFARFRTAKMIDGAWKPGSERDAETALRLFVELVGDRPLREIRREDALGFRTDLAEICSDWGQSPLYAEPVEGNPNRRVTARRAVEISRARPKTVKRLTPKTINKQVGPLNQVWDWAVENAGCGGLPHPFSKLQKKQRGRSRRSAAQGARDAFGIAEIQRIFQSELWRATSPFADDSRRALNAKPRPVLHFGPLLGAYGGLRLSEICQLRVGDIKPVDDFHVIDIRLLEDAPYAKELGAGRHTRPTEENKVKTVAADRQVPLHPVLVRCGFLDYLRLRGGRASDLLFLDVPSSAATRTRGLSNFFLELRRALEIDRPKLSFHSFRHTARTMLDNIIGDPGRVDLIIGHDDMTRDNEVRRTYNKGHWLRPHFEELGKLTYGIAAFGEDSDLIDRMRRGGFVLTL